MQRYQNNFSKAQGNSLRPVAGASVLVTTIGGAVATIYSDNGVTTTTNPLTTDANGMFAFYAADGRYSLTITSSETATVVVSDILLEDPQDGSAMVIDGGTISNSALSNVTIDGVAVAGSDIAKYSRLNDADGADLIGFSYAVSYAAGTLGKWLKDLATSVGSTLVGFIQSGTGATLRTVQDKLRETVSVKDFGAAGDGVADDTIPIQATISAVSAAGGGNVLFPVGTYIATTLYVPSNITMLGEGPASILKAKSALGNSSVLLQNSTVGSYADSYIGMRDMTLDGNNLGAGGAQSRLSSLVMFTRVTSLKIERVKVINHQYQGIAVAGCRRVTVESCDMSGLGFNGTTSNGGSAIWVGSYFTDMSEDVIVRYNHIHDNKWHGLHVSGLRLTVNGNHFINNQEAHIFAPRTLPDTDTSKLKIIGNTFDGVTKRDISAHAIETTARRIAISSNVIENCDHGGIAVQNAQEVTITGNVISNVNKINTTWSGIDIITDNASPNQPQNISITGNRIFDDQVVVTTNAAISITNAGAPITGLSMVGNDFGDTIFKSGNVFITNSKLGAGSKVKSNLGLSDNPAGAVFGEFSVSATGALSITGIGFKPVRLKIHAILPASAKESHGWIKPDGTNFSHNLTVTTTPAATGNTGPYAVNITDGTGAAQIRGTFTSFDTDGFTLNFSTVAATAWCAYEAFPD